MVPVRWLSDLNINERISAQYIAVETEITAGECSGYRLRVVAFTLIQEQLSALLQLSLFPFC